MGCAGSNVSCTSLFDALVSPGEQRTKNAQTTVFARRLRLVRETEVGKKERVQDDHRKVDEPRGVGECPDHDRHRLPLSRSPLVVRKQSSH